VQLELVVVSGFGGECGACVLFCVGDTIIHFVLVGVREKHDSFAQ
jgi:hypothetical protein